MVITIDTMSLIWCVKKKATPGQEQRLKDAERFLRWVESAGHKIQLTSTVAGE